MAEISVRPPNSLIIVGDPAGDLPETMGGGLFSSTSTGVAVGTRAEMDGETRIRIVEARSEVEQQILDKPVFAGELEVPSLRLTVESVLGDVYLERSVPEGRTVLEIWVNHETEPSEIVLVLR